MAADKLSAAGHKVSVFERLPSPARKFLMAGRGGLNLTHSEPLDQFTPRYRAAEHFLLPYVKKFTPQDLINWCEALGEVTFTGTSGRIFPKAMKASPLLRAWLKRLEAQGVTLHQRHTFTGFGKAPNSVIMTDPTGIPTEFQGKAALFALGGASWPKLGSDASWVSSFEEQGITVHGFEPANCGFQLNWSDVLVEKFAGTPLKSISLSHGDKCIQGEAILSAKGLEGGVVYALSAEIRDSIKQNGSTAIHLDLKPDLSLDSLTHKLDAPRRKQSLSNFLRKTAGLSPASVSLLREAGPLPETAEGLAQRIKELELNVVAPYPIERAISSAGGIALSEVDDTLMLRKRPGTFVAGEMLDWEAPTGGYLLQACFSMGVAAAEGIRTYLNETNDENAS